MSFVYFIESTNGATYIGVTVNLDKRIRQHNKELKGFKLATSFVKLTQGEIWSYICYVENFPSWNEALKFEWRWKQLSRQIQKKQPNLKPKEKRLLALDQLLKLEKSTSKAIPYLEWVNQPNVIYI